MYYEYESIKDRRARPEDGSVEYLVKWAGYDTATWEPRRNLTGACAEAVREADQQQMDRTDARLETWRADSGLTVGEASPPSPPSPLAATRKRARSAEDDTPIEVLHGILVCGAVAPTLEESVATAPVILLGEVVLTESAAAVLNNNGRRGGRRAGQGSKGKDTGASGGGGGVSLPELCAPAVALERSWRDRYGLALMHGCVGCERWTSLASGGFDSAAAPAVLSAELMRAHDDMAIVGLVPVEASASGRPFQQPASFLPWIGEAEGERLRRDSVADYPALGGAAQEVLRPQHERMLVRYSYTEVVEEEERVGEGEVKKEEEGDDAKSGATQQQKRMKIKRRLVSRPAVATMPLTVFRQVFPQMLLDYLLEHAVVFEG